jgi:outer membrane receptor for ferrienterochelin and colicins
MSDARVGTRWWWSRGCRALLLLLAGPLAAAPPPDPAGMFDLSLEELLQLTITTASRSVERVGDAPATVIVLTADELRRRGYRELSEIYDDLPGMDLSRPYGDTYFRNQWRGLRKTIGTPYLLMVDGVIFNHLYFNQEEIIAALPMANIAQVEVVYGPGSAVYGPNAFVGVINVITRQRLDADGQRFSGRLTAGSFDRRIADAHYLRQQGDWRFSLAGRFDRGDLDRSRSESYEWTRERYLQDRTLWGGMVERFGRYSSPHYNRALDLRLFHRDTELSLQHYTLDTHFGTVYPGDRIPMLSYWSEPEWSAQLRHPWRFGERLSGAWLLRYRTSGVANDSDTLEGFDIAGPGGAPQRALNYSYWAVETRSWSLFNDAEWTVGPHWNLLAGVKHERKDLQKAYRISYGPTVPPGAIGSADDYPLPPRPQTDLIPRNRIDTRDSALYALARFHGEDWWGRGETHSLLAGVRFDRNSEYGTARTLRGGYVLSRGRWTYKLLYGEAFNEPAPRELYGGWSGSGSNPTLDPETARTLESSLGWQNGRYSLLLSAYRLDSEDTIATFAGGARNLGDRSIRGLDLHLNARLPIGPQPWSLWAYYSYIDAAETRPQADGRLIEGPVGDTAPHKLHLGLTWPISERIGATLRGRYIDARRTVPTNPVGVVGSYSTFDLNLTWRDWPQPGVGWSLAVLNLTDRDYFHPGLREGNAGLLPGITDDAGRWQGSGGYYNSLLPQDGRGVFLSLQLDF